MCLKHKGLLLGLPALFILAAEMATIRSVSTDVAPQEPRPGVK